MYSDLVNQEKHSYVKSKIEFDRAKIKKLNLTEEDINFEYPKTPIIHYSAGHEKSFIMLLTKKDPTKTWWIRKDNDNTGQGRSIRTILTIQNSQGHPPNSYNQNPYDEDDYLHGELDEDERRNRYRRHH